MTCNHPIGEQRGAALECLDLKAQLASKDAELRALRAATVSLDAEVQALRARLKKCESVVEAVRAMQTAAGRWASGYGIAERRSYQDTLDELKTMPLPKETT